MPAYPPSENDARAAEHQQAAAAAIDELRDHLQLIAGERAGLDAAENQAAIREQLFARLREAGDELVGVVDAEAHVLVVGRPLQRDQQQVGIVVHRAADELHLGPRLALEVENLLPPVAHVDHGLARVVLGDQLAVLRRDAEAEHARPGVADGEAHASRRRRSIVRQLHLLRADDAAFVLDVERDGLARRTRSG